MKNENMFQPINGLILLKSSKTKIKNFDSYLLNIFLTILVWDTSSIIFSALSNQKFIQMKDKTCFLVGSWNYKKSNNIFDNLYPFFIYIFNTWLYSIWGHQPICIFVCKYCICLTELTKTNFSFFIVQQYYFFLMNEWTIKW